MFFRRLDDISEAESLANLISDPKSLSEEQISFNAVRDEVLAREIAERALHKNGRKFTPQTVTWIVQGFLRKVKAADGGKAPSRC